MKTWTTIGYVSLSATILLSVGCKKKASDQPPQEIHFGFSNTSVTVTADDAGIGNSHLGAVHADFNFDGLEDYAVINENNDGKQVTIYIRKNIPDDPASDPLYYNAGAIRRTLESNIIGLMSQRGAKYTDLIVLIDHPNQPNEMIHYRNDGTSFTEVP